MTEAPTLHNAATVILISDEVPPRTLLIKHKKLKSWLPPGGHQDNESPTATAIREVREETGIDISNQLSPGERLDDMAVQIPLPAYILHEQIPAYKFIPAHTHLDLIYRVRVPYQDPIQAEGEHDDIRWFTEKEIQELGMLENARHLVLDAFSFFNSRNKSQE